MNTVRMPSGTVSGGIDGEEGRVVEVDDRVDLPVAVGLLVGAVQRDGRVLADEHVERVEDAWRVPGKAATSG